MSSMQSRKIYLRVYAGGTCPTVSADVFHAHEKANKQTVTLDLDRTPACMAWRSCPSSSFLLPVTWNCLLLWDSEIPVQKSLFLLDLGRKRGGGNMGNCEKHAQAHAWQT